jgi:hypothetical protein
MLKRADDIRTKLWNSKYCEDNPGMIKAGRNKWALPE